MSNEPVSPKPLPLVHRTHPLLSVRAPDLQFPLSEPVTQALAHLGLTMLSFGPNAVGLAANQVGLPYRAFAWTHPELAGVLVNPSFVDAAEDPVDVHVDRNHHRFIQSAEGCLSLPHLKATVQRYRKIWANYQTLQGEARTVELSGFWATCFQHETDHLNGILIYQHLPADQQAKVLAAQEKQERKAKRKANA